METGETQQSYFPGLSRGLVAVILYYDGKASLVAALRMLIQARQGRTWALPGLGEDIVATATRFTDQIMRENLGSRILGNHFYIMYNMILYLLKLIFHCVIL